MEQLRTGAGGRIAAEDQAAKRHPHDFLMWKPDGSHIMRWSSPWGEGYPGWHIECSAMARKVLGRDDIDIHTGGEDNLFPHHECEIAQSEAATGEKFARHWLHVGMVAYRGVKMSKSLGNLVFVRDLRASYDPRAIRLALMAHHYRAGFEWFDNDIDDGARRLDRLLAAANQTRGPDPASTLAAVRAAIDDDLDLPAGREFGTLSPVSRGSSKGHDACSAVYCAASLRM